MPRDGLQEGARPDTAPEELEDLVAPHEIARKVRRARLVRDPGRELLWRGAFVGFLVGCFLSAGLTGVALYQRYTAPHAANRMDFGLLFMICVFLMTFICPPLCSLGTLLLWGLFKPIIMAVFYSPEAFEREYGPTGKQAGRRPRGGR